jgi:5-methylcytosine-specific restriction endonuclease McrA
MPKLIRKSITKHARKKPSSSAKPQVQHHPRTSGAQIPELAHAKPHKLRQGLLEGLLEDLHHEPAKTLQQVRLTIELVPKTCWYSNVRSNITSDEWDQLRRPVLERAGRVCEVCGGRGQEHPVECHEIWRYDDASRVQKLIGLIALCPSCHRAKHYGLAKRNGHGPETDRHLATVNGWTPEQVKEYVRVVFAIWKLRSEVEWHLDLGWLSAQGISVKACDAQRRKERSVTAQQPAAANR